MLLLLYVAFVLVQFTAGLRFIDVTNRHNFPIWIETKTNPDSPGQLTQGITRLDPGRKTRYSISDAGWAGRLWPKTGCNGRGVECEFGQSVEPCPKGGCQPPSETKVEFFFPPINSRKDSFYDISLVDGFSLGSQITPIQNGRKYNSGSCIVTNCQLHLSNCPRNEPGLGDLTVKGRSNNVVSCLSPCKKWNYPRWGYGRSENTGDGPELCCPHGVTVERCRAGKVVRTQYVKLLRSQCKSAYSYSYDDLGGLHNCPTSISYDVKFFP